MGWRKRYPLGIHNAKLSYYFVASGHSILKDADDNFWEIERALENPNRGHLE